MKKIAVLSIVIVAAIAGAFIYLNQQKAPPVPAPARETAPGQVETTPQEIVSISKPEPVTPVATTTPTPATAAVPPSAVADSTPNESTNSIRKTVDALLAARREKAAMLDQLSKQGQLEAVIAELQQRAAANPKDAKIPTTLGEAQLYLVRTLHESNADPDQVGILAMQADQSFNTALKIDPQNWEAQFVKASTMYYWPPNDARDNDAVQRLSHLIDQQETMTQHPEFVQTYLALGKQYQKMGKSAEAIATWQLGLQKFPGDPALVKSLSGQ